MASEAEQRQEQVSKDVSTTIEHLRQNRTTEREAHDLQDAARRSISDHGAAKALR